jgi:hypothetical protein
MAKNVGRLAGLAALAGAAYMMRDKFGKDATGPAATAGEEKASKARTDAQKNAVSGSGATNESSYTGTTKNTADAAKNIGFGGGDDSDKNLKRVEPAPPPPPKKEPVDPFANYEGGDLLTGTRSSMPALNVPDAIKNESVAKTNAMIAQQDANKSANAGNMKDAAKKYSVATDQYKNLSRAAAVTDARKREEKQLKKQSREDKLRASGGRRAAGGAIKKMASGGMTSKVSSASKRADGIASRGKTRCKMY